MTVLQAKAEQIKEIKRQEMFDNIYRDENVRSEEGTTYSHIFHHLVHEIFMQSYTAVSNAKLIILHSEIKSHVF